MLRDVAEVLMQSWPRFPANVSDPIHDDPSSHDSHHAQSERGPYRAAPCAACAEREARASPSARAPNERPRRERSRAPVASLAAGAVAGAVLVGSVTALTTPRLDAQASRLSALERRMTDSELDARAFEGRVDHHVARLDATVGTNDRLARGAVERLRQDLELDGPRLADRAPTERGFDVVSLTDTDFLVSRSVFVRDRGAALARVRLMPNEREGVMIGVRVFGVQPGSLPAQLGVQNGDTLVSVNGVSLAGPPDVDRLSEIARDSTVAELVLLRRGELVRLHYTLVG